MPTIIERIRNAGRALSGVPLQLDTSVLGPRDVASIPLRSGQSAGWLDPNELFTPDVLYGTSTTPGLLWSIRQTDDVVQPAADSRRELLQSLEYDIVPRRRYEKDPTAIVCAAACNAIWQDMEDRTAPVWVAETYDYWSAIGHTLYEMRLAETGRLKMNFVRRGLLNRWEQDATGYGWSKAWVQNRLGIGALAEEHCAYFARNPLPGQFDGNSAYRCLVSPATTTYELYSNLLDSMAWSRGFMHASSTGEGEPTARDNENVKSFLDAIEARKRASAITTSAAIKFTIVSSQVPSMQNFAPLATSQSEAKNRAAMNALSNIGLQSHGSRSLAEVVADADQAKVRAHMDGFMDVISGDNRMHGTMMRTLVKLAGYDGAPLPRIVVRWTDKAERLSADHVAQVVELLDRKLLYPTEPMTRYLSTNMGFPVDVVDSQIAAAREAALQGTAEGRNAA